MNSEQLALIYAQCLTAAATMAAADRIKPDGDYPMSTFHVGRLADDWFRRTILEAEIAEADWAEMHMQAMRERGMRLELRARPPVEDDE